MRCASLILGASDATSSPRDSPRERRATSAAKASTGWRFIAARDSGAASEPSFVKQAAASDDKPPASSVAMTRTKMGVKRASPCSLSERTAAPYSGRSNEPRRATISTATSSSFNNSEE
jgi:hypothetical protein